MKLEIKKRDQTRDKIKDERHTTSNKDELHTTRKKKHHKQKVLLSHMKKNVIKIKFNGTL